MAQPLFALAHRTGALPQVYTLTGASPLSIGDPLPAGAIEGPVTDVMSCYNRVIQFGADIYAASLGGVYKKNDPTSLSGAWTLDQAFTNQTLVATKQHCVLGPYQLTYGGSSKLFVCWLTDTSAATWNAAILDGDTGTWSLVGEQASVTTVAEEPIGASIMYRGVLYAVMRGSTATEILTFDPAAGSFGQLTATGTDESQTLGLGVFNDRLLALGAASGTGNAALFEISGSFTQLFEIAPAIAISPTEQELRHALVPSPNGSVLYGIVNTTTGGTGSVFLKFIDTAGTISFDSDITTPVMPAGLRPGSGTATQRWWAHYDQETTPGTAILLLYFSPDGASGSVVTQYLFVDEITVMTQEDAGGSAAWGFSNVTTGGGERIFTPGELNIEITDRLAVLGGEALRFKCWGDPGTADKNVEFRYNTETEVPLALATLTGTPAVISGAAATPTLNGGLNRLEGVEADGTSVYEIVWDIATDGVAAGQRAQLVPRIFI